MPDGGGCRPHVTEVTAMDCGNCGRHVSGDWRGTLCPYCGATLYAAMDVAATILALAGAAALMWLR